MTWTKSRLTIWESAGFRITEDAAADRPYRLDSPGAAPEFFADLEQAKAVAALRNDLELFKLDNERLRAELDERRQGDSFERGAVIAGSWPGNGNGHKAPAPSVPAAETAAVAGIARELVSVMAERLPPAERDDDKIPF